MNDRDAAAALRKWLDETEVQERAHFTSFEAGLRNCIIAIGWLFFGGALLMGGAGVSDGDVVAAMASPGLLVSSILCAVWSSTIRSRATHRMQFRHLLNALRRRGE